MDNFNQGIFIENTINYFLLIKKLILEEKYKNGFTLNIRYNLNY